MPSVKTTNDQSTIVGGIPIWPRAGTGERGTLTAVARRNSDQRRVLVTCHHVVHSGQYLYGLSGDEFIYHGGTEEANKVGQLYVLRNEEGEVEHRSWSVIRPGLLDDDGFIMNPPDIAALEVLNGVPTNFGVHFPNDDDSNHTHTFRPIVTPSVDPRVGMNVMFVGAYSGQRNLPIASTSPTESAEFVEYHENSSVVDKIWRFPGSEYFILNQLLPGGDKSNYGGKGDSGAPLLWEDDDGNLRLVGIRFGSEAQDVWAVPAPLVERYLKVTFGVKAPTAVAEYRVGNVVRPRVVHSGQTVTLDGSGSEVKEPEASPLTYQWNQVLPEPAVGTPNVTIANRTQQTASFTAPPGNNSLEFKLTVTDSNGAKASTTVDVTVVNTPPIPTGDQWEVRQLENKIQVKITELPTVIPAISQVKAKLGISPLGTGLGSDTVTVTKDIGTTLNQWVDVLTDADSKWQAGTWTAQVRFENTEGNSEYSPGMAVTVVSAPTNVSATPAARSVEVAWKVVTGAMGYKVEIGIPPSEGGQNHTFHNSIGTSITIPSLTPQTTYEYRVQATNDSGVGPWTAWARVVTPGETPPKPTGTQWDVRYWARKIQVKVKELPTLIPAISQVMAKLGIGTGLDKTTVTKAIGTTLDEWLDVLTSSDADWQEGAWTAQVRFENTIGDPKYAMGKAVTVEYLPPTADVGVSRLAYLGERVLLDSWDSTANEPGAIIASRQWSFIPDPADQTPPVPRLGWNRTSLNFTAPTAPTTWRFRLTVTDSNGLTASAEIEVEFIRLPPPGRVSATATDTTASVTWRAVYGATGYEVEIGASRTNTTTHTATGASITIEALTSGTTHEYRVRATNGDAKGEWSGWKTVTTGGESPPPPTVTAPTEAPSNVSATPAVNSVDISWDAVTGATGYEVKIGLSRTNTTTHTATGTTITIDNLVPQRTYHYQVRGKNDGGPGPWSAWATVDTEGEDPPTPTNEQWDIGYDSDNNNIQMRLNSLPSVIPAITAVELTMETGQPPNLTTVVKTLSVTDITIGAYTAVLSSADANWQTGTWIAQIRYKNPRTFSGYSTTKSVTVPTCTWEDVSPPETRNRVEGDWTDTGQTRENPVTLIVEKEQTRTVTWEKKQQCTSGDTTHYQWVSTSTTETRWESCPADTDWVDAGQTRVASYGAWQRTTQTRGSGQNRECKETRTVESEKKQTRIRDCDPQAQWVSTTSTTETRWVSCPVPPCTWVDVSPAEYQGCGPDREKKQECTSHGSTETRWVPAPTTLVWTAFRDVSPAVTRNRSEGTWTNTGRTREDDINLVYEEEQTLTTTWEKKKISTNQCGTTPRYQWVDASSARTRWRVIPENCGRWSDTGQTRVKSRGAWSRTGQDRGSGANRECEEERTVSREKQQSCTTNPPYNNTRYQWVGTTSTTDTQWVSCPEEEWPDTWTDTGSIEDFDAGTWRDLSTTQGCGSARERKQSRIATWRKEQFQRSNLGNRRTRWIAASRISFQWRDYPEPLRWTEWTDTGQRRENQVLLIIEKQQKRTSHCDDVEYRWVVA